MYWLDKSFSIYRKMEVTKIQKLFYGYDDIPLAKCLVDQYADSDHAGHWANMSVAPCLMNLQEFAAWALFHPEREKWLKELIKKKDKVGDFIRL